MTLPAQHQVKPLKNLQINEVKFIKCVKNPADTHTTSEVPSISPPRIINVTYSDEKGTSKSLFHDDEITIDDQDNENKESVQNEETQNTKSVPPKQKESVPDRDTQQEKKRIFESAFSATSPP